MKSERCYNRVVFASPDRWREIHGGVYLLDHKSDTLLFMAPVWGATIGWFLLLLTVGGYPWWTHLLNHNRYYF
jgi:hypothetical protein